MTMEQPQTKPSKFKSREEYNIRLVVTEENDGETTFKIAWAQKLIPDVNNNSGTWTETPHKQLVRRINANKLGSF